MLDLKHSFRHSVSVPIGQQHVDKADVFLWATPCLHETLKGAVSLYINTCKYQKQRFAISQALNCNTHVTWVFQCIHFCIFATTDWTLTLSTLILQVVKHNDVCLSFHFLPYLRIEKILRCFSRKRKVSFGSALCPNFKQTIILKTRKLRQGLR